MEALKNLVPAVVPASRRVLESQRASHQAAAQTDPAPKAVLTNLVGNRRVSLPMVHDVLHKPEVEHLLKELGNIAEHLHPA